MSHSLIVGGSGMLAALSRDLANRGDQVSVIGRTPRRLAALVDSVTGSGAIRPIALDYRRPSDLGIALARATHELGAVTRTICWVHEEVAPDAPIWIAERVTGCFVHVLGSATADPSRPETLGRWRASVTAANPDLDYKQAVLGFRVGAPGGSRWLTDAEIVQGVGDTLAGEDALTIIGAVTPWSRRP